VLRDSTGNLTGADKSNPQCINKSAKASNKLDLMDIRIKLLPFNGSDRWFRKVLVDEVFYHT